MELDHQCDRQPIAGSSEVRAVSNKQNQQTRAFPTSTVIVWGDAQENFDRLLLQFFEWHLVGLKEVANPGLHATSIHFLHSTYHYNRPYILLIYFADLSQPQCKPSEARFFSGWLLGPSHPERAVPRGLVNVLRPACLSVPAPWAQRLGCLHGVSLLAKQTPELEGLLPVSSFYSYQF